MNMARLSRSGLLLSSKDFRKSIASCPIANLLSKSLMGRIHLLKTFQRSPVLSTRLRHQPATLLPRAFAKHGVPVRCKSVGAA